MTSVMSTISRQLGGQLPRQWQWLVCGPSRGRAVTFPLPFGRHARASAQSACASVLFGGGGGLAVGLRAGAGAAVEHLVHPPVRCRRWQSASAEAAGLHDSQSDSAADRGGGGPSHPPHPSRPSLFKSGSWRVIQAMADNHAVISRTLDATPSLAPAEYARLCKEMSKLAPVASTVAEIRAKERVLTRIRITVSMCSTRQCTHSACVRTRLTARGTDWVCVRVPTVCVLGCGGASLPFACFGVQELADLESLRSAAAASDSASDRELLQLAFKDRAECLSAVAQLVGSRQ